MRTDSINMLDDTLKILDRGFYYLDGKEIPLKLSPAQMREISVYLPEDVQKIRNSKEYDQLHLLGNIRINVDCENMDSYSLATKRMKNVKYPLPEGSKPVLVLNFANPVNPGGGVRRGAKAQEEDLCRKSSLLLSLESQEAAAYYKYNKSLHSYMSSDAIMITPQVEIIKDEKGNLLPESVVVAVMTCAAPLLSYGMEGLTDQQYQDLFYNRITGMLAVAAYLGYRELVLGAFGCGAFGNDAKVVSDLFYKALKEFDYGGSKAKDFFNQIDFAVMDHSQSQYNFKEFSRNFSDFYRNETAQDKDGIRRVTEEPFCLSYCPSKKDANINNVTHGGVLFYLCDEAIGRYFTAKGMKGAAADASIHYYRPAPIGEKLLIQVTERKVGKRLGTYLVELKDEKSVLLAEALFTIAFLK